MNNETRKETQVLPKDVRCVGADDLIDNRCMYFTRWRISKTCFF